MLTMNQEIRPSAHTLEYKRSGESEGVITGYIAKYEEPAEFQGRSEVVDKGAFARFLRSERLIPALYDHNPDVELAHMRDGGVRLWDDGIGMMYRIKAGAGGAWDTIRSAIDAGTRMGCSFYFDPYRSKVFIDHEGRRHLNDLWLNEVTITPRPVYKQTSVTARAWAEYDANAKRAEDIQQAYIDMVHRGILSAYEGVK